MSSADGGPDLAVVPPTAPHPLDYPCGPGFETVVLPGGNTTCEPWAEVPSCADGEILLATGCEAISPTCELTGLSSAAVFVRPGATGGDGTRERPFGTIDQARRVSSEIALFEGTHEAPMGISLNGTHLIGACAGGTVVRLGAHVVAQGMDNEIRSVSLESAAMSGGLVSARADAELRLSSVELRNVGRALEAHRGATLVLRRVAVRDATDAMLIAFDALSIDAEQVSCERAVGAGISLEHDDALPVIGSLRLVDATFTSLGAFPSPTPNFAGVRVVAAVSVTLSNVIVEQSAIAGALLAATESQIEDLFVRGSTATLSLGLLDVNATLHRVTVMDGLFGIFVGGGSVNASDIALVRAAPPLVLRDTTATFERLVISEGGGTAIESGIGTATYRDVSIFDEGPSLPNDGAGLSVRDGGSVTVERIHIERVAMIAISVSSAEDGTPSHLTVWDAEILDVAYRNILEGAGIVAEAGTTLEVHRAHVTRAHTAGVYVHAATAELFDLRVEETTGLDTTFGVGLLIAGEAEGRSVPTHVTLQGGELVHNERWSCVVAGHATQAEFERLTISGTSSAPCVSRNCLGTGGIGLFIVNRAAASVSDFRVEHSVYSGVLLANDVTVSLRNGRIEHNVFGLVQPPHLSPPPTILGVVFSDNTTNFENTSISYEIPVIDITPSPPSSP